MGKLFYACWSQQQPPRDRSRDHRQIGVNYGIYRPLFNQSEAGILFRGMTLSKYTI